MHWTKTLPIESGLWALQIIQKDVGLWLQRPCLMDIEERNGLLYFIDSTQTQMIELCDYNIAVEFGYDSDMALYEWSSQPIEIETVKL